jgi:uncharacterized repeat protein (TIGR03803 family)
VVTVIRSFTGGPGDGANPGGSLAYANGLFFGMTAGGGQTNDGTLFSMAPDGSAYSVLHNFAFVPGDGIDPLGTPVVSGNTVYGVTLGSATGNQSGTVFKSNTDGTGFTVLHYFNGGANDGASPLGSVVLSGNTLYCMTSQGGTANLGTVFKINTDGTGAAILHSFTGGGGDGGNPSYSALTVSGSTIYGMTVGGGATGQGTIFRMNADGSGFTLMHVFNSSGTDGWAPYGSLALYNNTLYGMTRKGGPTGLGTVFSINTDSSGYTQLYSFKGGPTDGANPLGSLLVANEEIFGTTIEAGANGFGSIFEMGLDGSAYQTLHFFGGAPSDGSYARDTLIEKGGVLYSTTANGGAADDGVVFSIAVPEPSSLLLVLAGSAPGAMLAALGGHVLKVHPRPNRPA